MAVVQGIVVTEECELFHSVLPLKRFEMRWCFRLLRQFTGLVVSTHGPSHSRSTADAERGATSLAHADSGRRLSGPEILSGAAVQEHRRTCSRRATKTERLQRPSASSRGPRRTLAESVESVARSSVSSNAPSRLHHRSTRQANWTPAGR